MKKKITTHAGAVYKQEGAFQRYLTKQMFIIFLNFQTFELSVSVYPQNPFRSIYACKRMPSAYPDDR